MATYGLRAQAASASAAAKVCCSLQTPAGVTAKITGASISFDGTDSTKTPILVELVKTTAAPSGGAAGTSQQLEGAARTSQLTTVRINDTVDGSSPTILRSWYVSPTIGVDIQLPLNREIDMAASAFYELRATTVSGSATPNYAANLEWEEGSS